MALLVDIKHSRKRAFIRGFWRGLAGPLMLFAHTSVPALPKIEPIKLPARMRDPMGGIASDWEKIGGDLKSAVRRHEQKNKKSGHAAT